MEWEDLEDEMHFAFLAGIVPGIIMAAYYQLIDYVKDANVSVDDALEANFDLHLLMFEVRIDMDDNFFPLFNIPKLELQDISTRLKEELSKGLTTLANSSANCRFSGKSIILSLSFTIDHIH